MATKKPVNPFNKPVHPYAAVAVLVGSVALVIVAVFAAFRFSYSPSTQKIVSAPIPSTAPTVTPTPIDTSNWKTYTDWKYGFSIKLPPQYYSMEPGRGATGSDPDPSGGGEMNFEDSQYRVANNNYGFTVRIHKGNGQQKNCTTDEECYTMLFGSNTKANPISTKILGRDIKGYISIDSNHYPNYVGDVYFEFTQDGKPYELDIYDIGGLAQVRTKQPFIDAIASTISIN